MHPGIRACFCLLVGQEGDKEADLPEWFKAFELPQPQFLNKLILPSLIKLVFQMQASKIDRPMVLTEPTVPSAQPLGLGSKLYPYGNKQHICSTKILLD